MSYHRRTFGNVPYYAALLTCLLFALPHASAALQLNQYDKLDTVESITADKAVVVQLKKLLGNEYDNFISNFDVYGEPHHTADGGLFVSGWMQHLAQENASVFVIYPDGRLSAAWILPDDSVVNYRTNHPNDGIDRDIQQWASQLEGKTLPDMAPQDASFTGTWQGKGNDASTLSLKLTQMGNKVIGTYCYITQQGNRIDCADEDKPNLLGSVKNNVATISFDSNFGAVNGQATLKLEGSTLRWTMTRTPVNGEYYAPEQFDLSKEDVPAGATTRLLQTAKFTLFVRNNCGAFLKPCDDVLYNGVRNSDNTTISLKGKTLQDSANNVTGAEFHNGNITYRVDYQQPGLVVMQGAKVLVNQPAKWLN
ncbi:hypothetical protein [Kosakonia cowanii]|jgi:hypothetical protein|uniref:hypothetical protein n=1 Tax=Kosakonia cowanii TaxID=208223 RepID=UPI000347AC6F|nr:hypothetical protein [Kosakonia cowanii]MDT3412476.1 hypothetical protein [Atlantibacter sp. SORGH_AS_0304]